MTTLLSTPNSLASSYTRTLATSLLLGPGCRRRTVATSWAYSSRTHRVLIAISTYFQLARYLTARGSVPYCFLRCRLLDLLHRWRSAATSSGPGPRKARGNARRRTARSRQTEVGMHIRTPAGQRTAMIGDAYALARHDAQQIGSWPLAPGIPHRFAQGMRGPRPARHC